MALIDIHPRHNSVNGAVSPPGAANTIRAIFSVTTRIFRSDEDRRPPAPISCSPLIAQNPEQIGRSGPQKRASVVLGAMAAALAAGLCLSDFELRGIAKRLRNRGAGKSRTGSV